MTIFLGGGGGVGRYLKRNKKQIKKKKQKKRNARSFDIVPVDLTVIKYKDVVK